MIRKIKNALIGLSVCRSAILLVCLFVSWLLPAPLGGGGICYAGQLLFDGVPVDITTAANEDLVIAPGTGGNTQIGDASGTNSHATSNDDLHITGKLETDGTAYFDSATYFNSGVTLGDATSDTITVSGYFGSHLIPATDSSYDLGSSSLTWRNIYVDTISGYNSALALNPATGYSLTGAVTKNAATGNEIAYDLAATINKATAGNYTGLRLNVTETSAPGAADLLLDLQIAGASMFSVDNAGNLTAAGTITGAASALTGTTSNTFTINSDNTTDVTATLTLGGAGTGSGSIGTTVGRLALAPANNNVYLNASHLIVSADGTYNIGDTTNRFNTVYTDNLGDTGNNLYLWGSELKFNDTYAGDVRFFYNVANAAQASLYIYDTTTAGNFQNSGYLRLYHDGSNGILTTSKDGTGTAGDILLYPGDEDVKMYAQNGLSVINDATATDTITIRHDDTNGIISTTTGDIYLQPNGSDVIVDTAGTTKLTIDRGANTNYSLLSFSTSDAAAWDVGTRNTGNEDLQIFNLGVPNAAAIYIEAATNEIGIGDTSPDAELDVESLAPTIYLTDTTALAKSLAIEVDANLADLREIAGASGSLMTLDLANNRIGIGTNSPEETLQVGRDVAASGTGNVRVTADDVAGYYENEANPRWELNRDMGGGSYAGVGLGPGGATALDTKIWRQAAYQLRTTAYQLERDVTDGYFKIIAGTDNSQDASIEMYGRSALNNEARFRILLPNPAGADGFDIMRGGDWAQLMTMDTNGASIFNKSNSASGDFTVQGQTDNNLLFCDASADKVIFGSNTSSATSKIEVLGADNSTAAIVKINAAQANITAADTFIDFRSTTGSEGSIAGTAVAGQIIYNTFTGSHWTKVDDRGGLEPSVLLEATGEKFKEGKGQLVKSRICKTKKSKAVYGVYGGTDKDGNDMVLALGSGYIWVVNKGKDIEIGDYLTSSDVPGCAEKQDDDMLHNYTVAKVLEPIKWKKAETKRLIACTLHSG